MRKNLIISLAIVSILIFGSLIVSAGNNGEQSQSKSIESMKQLRNRICDMLGICLGGCNLTEITGVLVYDEENFFIDDNAAQRRISAPDPFRSGDDIGYDSIMINRKEFARSAGPGHDFIHN